MIEQYLSVQDTAVLMAIALAIIGTTIKLYQFKKEGKF